MSPYETIELPAVVISQDGAELYLTKMTPLQLSKFATIERFDSNLPLLAPEQGYQRNPDNTRIRQFRKWLEEEKDRRGQVVMPTAILLAARNQEIPRKNDGSIQVRSDRPLFLVDGQHRTQGFMKAIGDGLVDFEDYELPVVIMTGMKKVDEMHQFQVVNSTQKSVRTDLVNMILNQILKESGEAVLSEKERDKATLSQVTTQLNDDPRSPWFKRIIMPDKAAESEIQSVRATSFMSSLRPIDKRLYDKKYDATRGVLERANAVVAAVSSFWLAIKSFESLSDVWANPTNYVLLKTPGVFALHLVCRRFLDQIPAGRRADQVAYYDLLDQSERMKTPEFWSTGVADETGSLVQPRGEAANFGSMKGFSQLAELILEEIEFD